MKRGGRCFIIHHLHHTKELNLLTINFKASRQVNDKDSQ